MGSMMGMSAEKDRKTERLMKKQKQEEELRIAEEESEIAKRKALHKKGGRSLLVATSEKGTTPLQRKV